MPPSNTPAQSFTNSLTPRTASPRPQTPPSYLSALHELESPVLDLASTLTTTAAEDEADAENVRFLRRLMDEDWPSQDARANRDTQNGPLIQSGDTASSENRGRILPVPVPEQSRTLEHSSTPQRWGEIDDSRQRFAAEREVIERELRRQRNQHSDRSMQDEEEVERVVRLQGILSRLNRLQEPAYGNRIPSQQSLYDWAPANDEDDGEELEDILRELRQQQPNTHPEILRVLGRSQLDAEREARSRAYSSRFLNNHTSSHPESSESSLRSAAILQSVRRHPRFAARSRDHLQRYVMDRERTGNDNEDRDRSNARWTRPLSLESTRYELNRLAWQTQQRLHDHHPRDGQSRVEALRRNYLDNPSSQNTTSSLFLESAIKYLSRLRDSTCYEQSLSYAVDGGFVTNDFFGEQHDDFILDPEMLLPPPPSSWLAPGMTFEGSQQASLATTSNSQYGQPLSNGHGASTTTTYRLPNNQSITSTTFDPAISRSGTSGFDASRPWLSHTFTHPNVPGESARAYSSTGGQDNWPVRVTIHTVDYENMTLSGTMEAFNVPDQPPTYSGPWLSNNGSQNTMSFNENTSIHSAHHLPTPPSSTSPPFRSFFSSSTGASSPKGIPITTYLEGEILDFEHFHTLQTTSFPSSLSTDAVYWRKLPPLNHHDADEKVVRQLVSKKGYEELRRDWILMRWKERHFVQIVGRDCWARYTGASPALNANSPTTTAQLRTADPDPDADKMMLDGVPSPAMGDTMQGRGLTISGFYYVCLRRSDGRVEGLYYDPQSSPYQYLRLNPVRVPGIGLAASGLR